RQTVSRACQRYLSSTNTRLPPSTPSPSSFPLLPGRRCWRALSLALAAVSDSLLSSGRHTSIPPSTSRRVGTRATRIDAAPASSLCLCPRPATPFATTTRPVVEFVAQIHMRDGTICGHGGSLLHAADSRHSPSPITLESWRQGGARDARIYRSSRLERARSSVSSPPTIYAHDGTLLHPVEYG
ncbi:hypothetical protein OG21DRAFT_1573917, partial [Imleria badia]